MPLSSVALSMPGPSPALGAEADLIRRASRSDEGAFSEIYRRHAQTAWRLAQAITAGRDEATSAVADGFVRVLRAVRRHQVKVSDPFRPLLLAGVYRSAIEERRRADQAVTAPIALNQGELSFDAAAFRTLPERWRAAIWLTEVEGLAPDRVAPILGVSPAVATQLASRGLRAMNDRYRQAGSEPPESLGPALRPLAATLPASLAEVAAAAWRSSVASDTAGRLVPCLGWLGERAVQPLRLAVVGVMALGVIAVGVISQGGLLGERSPVAGGGAPSATSRAGVNYFSPIAAFPDGSGLLLGAGGSAGPLRASAPSGLPRAGGAGAASPAAAGSSGSSGSAGPAGGSGASGGSTGSGSGGSTGATGGSGGGSTPNSGGNATSPVTTLGGGGGTTSTGGLSVTASPSSGVDASVSGGSTPTTLAQATVLAPNCTLSASVAGVQLGQTCTSSTTTAASTTTTTAPSLLNITAP